MIKSAIGFVVGIAFAAGLWALVRARDAGGEVPEATAASRSDAKGPTAGLRSDGERSSLPAVEAEIARLEAEAAALRARPVSAKAKPRMTFAELAKKLVPAFAEDTWIWETDDERTQALLGPFLEELRARALEKGISLYEAAQGPDGVAALAMAMLAAMDPPPDAETMKTLEEAKAALGKEFDDYLGKRDSLSRLEQYQELQKVGNNLAKTADDALSGDASDRWWNAGDFWDQARQTDFVSFNLTGTAPGAALDDVCREWTESWSANLGFDASQKLALKPIVDEYARAIAELNVEADKRRTGNQGARPSYKDQLALMIQAEKRVAAELSLTEKQLKALRNWSQIPSHSFRSTR